MNRRQFCKSAAGISIAGLPAFLATCRNKVTAPDLKPDFVLQGNESSLATTANNQLSLIQRMVESRSGKVFIGIPASDGDEVLTMEMMKGGEASYHHIRLMRENGEVVNLTWGSMNLFPSFKLTDDNGKLLVRNGRELEFRLDEAGTASNPSDWFRLAIKVLAIALAIWIGAKVVGLIIVALAFLAFYAMIFALFVLAIVFLKWIADKFGWDLDKVRDFFRMAIQAIIDLFREIVMLIGGGVYQFEMR